MSFGMKILVGVGAGILAGVLFGDLLGGLDLAGQVYVGLLQMTVLPFVTVSLVDKIGRLTTEQARAFMGRAGLVILVLWTISLATVLILPLSLPDWDAGTFFSASLVEEPAAFDFLGLYLPTNPFHSLANNVVPAVVLFSILFGIALIRVPEKERLLEPLGAISNALGAISGFIVRLAPYGTFALIAAAAGELSPGELGRIVGYVSTFTAAVVLLSFVILPGLVAAITPLSMRSVIGCSRDAALTAFATGKLFAVLPMIINGAADLLVSAGIPRDRAESAADVYVPLGYPFPNGGKLMSILFIPFAAWFMGTPLELSQYPMLLSVGLLAFFGSALAAIPFLLDLMRLPADLLPLFLVAGIWCSRVGDVLGAAHLSCFTLICTLWNEGQLRVRPARVVRWIALGLGTTAAALFLNHAVIERTLEGQQGALDLIASMGLTEQFVEIEVAEAAGPNPAPRGDGESVLERIRRTGELRVGFVDKTPPFSHRNARDEHVGFDVDLIQRFAWDLGVNLVLVPTKRIEIKERLERDDFDLAIGGIPSTIETFDLYHESRPYLDLHGAILVRDHEAKHYKTIADMQEKAAHEGIRLGHEKDGIFVRRTHVAPGFERIEVETLEAFVKGETEADAMIVSAETGAVVTMVYPEYSVVIPKNVNVQIPLVFPVQESPELRRILDSWIQIREDDGTVGFLYDYWVLGRSAQQSHERRWSVIRNVLHWVD